MKLSAYFLGLACEREPRHIEAGVSMDCGGGTDTQKHDNMAGLSSYVNLLVGRRLHDFVVPAILLAEARGVVGGRKIDGHVGVGKGVARRRPAHERIAPPLRAVVLPLQPPRDHVLGGILDGLRLLINFDDALLHHLRWCARES